MGNDIAERLRRIAKAYENFRKQQRNRSDSPTWGELVADAYMKGVIMGETLKTFKMRRKLERERMKLEIEKIK